MGTSWNRPPASTGWFFRDEAVLEDASELAEVLRTDGEAVAVGDTVAAMLVTRFVEGKDWLERKLGKKTGEPAEAKTAQSV